MDSSGSAECAGALRSAGWGVRGGGAVVRGDSPVQPAITTTTTIPIAVARTVLALATLEVWLTTDNPLNHDELPLPRPANTLTSADRTAAEATGLPGRG